MHKNWELFKVYLIAGTFTFSGGIAMLPAIERELVTKRHLMSKEDLYEYSTLAQTLPGVIALTNACFVGKKVNGYAGMAAAAFGATLPAFALMALATAAYQMIPQGGVALAILSAIRAASAAFLFSAAFSLARYNLKNLPTIAIAVGCFLLTALTQVSAPWLLLGAGAIGILMTRRPKNA